MSVTIPTSSNSALVDALPYIDFEYDEPGMKETVMAMIEDEKRRYRPTKNYLEHLPPLDLHRFETPLMKKEFERLQQRQPREELSMKRYELPPPPVGKLTDLTAWTECVDNSCAQLEHQATRLSNLDLILEYGSEAWKSHLEVLNVMIVSLRRRLNVLKREIQEINWARKNAQTSTGEQLARLENSWVGLIGKNYEIEIACNALEAKIYQQKATLAQAEFMVAEAEAEAKEKSGNGGFEMQMYLYPHEAGGLSGAPGYPQYNNSGMEGQGASGENPISPDSTNEVGDDVDVEPPHHHHSSGMDQGNEIPTSVSGEGPQEELPQGSAMDVDPVPHPQNNEEFFPDADKFANDPQNNNGDLENEYGD